MKDVDVKNEARRLRTEEKKSLKEIAAILGIAKSTASLWLREHQVPVVRSDTLRYNKIRELIDCNRDVIEGMLASGTSYDDIAPLYDMPTNVFKSWCSKVRIKGPKRMLSENHSGRCLICDKAQQGSKRKYCNTCWTRLKRYMLRVKAVEYKGALCQRCGWSGDASGFDFHHRDPGQKDFAISSPNNHSWLTVKTEIDKCDLLCALCHRLEHKGHPSEKLLKAAETFSYLTFDVDDDLLAVNQLSDRTLRSE